jgi:hypothetical protein
MTLWLGYGFSFLIGITGTVGCVLVYQILSRVVAPIVVPLKKRYPWLKKPDVYFRTIFFFAGMVVIPICLRVHFARMPEWKPYLMDTSIGFSLGVGLSPLVALGLAFLFNRKHFFHKAIGHEGTDPRRETAAITRCEESTDAVRLEPSWKMTELMISLAMVCFALKSIPLIDWILIVCAGLLLLRRFGPKTSYDSRAIYQKIGFGKPRIHSWDDVRSVKSMRAMVKNGLFSPLTRVDFKSGGMIQLSQAMTRNYLGVLANWVHILDAKGFGNRVDSETRLFIKGNALKGRRFPFILAYFFIFVFIGSSFVAFMTTWNDLHWTPAQALVQEAYRTVSRSVRSRTYYWHLTLKYTIADGSQETAKTTFDGLYLDDWRPGQEVQVLYNPSQPDKIVMGYSAVWTTFLAALGLLGLGIFVFFEAEEDKPYFYFSKVNSAKKTNLSTV